MTHPGVVVLACDDVASVAGVDVSALEDGLRRRCADVRVHIAAGGCRDAGALVRDIDHEGRAVLALCGPSLPSVALQAALRRAGLEPIGVPIVGLAARCAGHSPPIAAARAELLVAAAVARARAFRGIRPGQLRLRATSRRTRRSLLLADIAYDAVPTIEDARCVADVGCGLCVRACPTSALVRDGDRIVLDRSRCDGCGACVAACPRDAVELPAYRAEELAAELSALLEDDDGALGPLGIVFVCRHAELRDEAPGWLPVTVPSLRLLSPLWVVRCLAAGASAVALLGCERCGDAQVLTGIAWCRALLERIGADPDRARLLSEGTSALAGPPLAPLRAARMGPVSLDAPSAVLSLLGGDEASDIPDLAHPGSPFGLVSVNGQRCTLCGACAKACPAEALALDGMQGDVVLTFDHGRCVACGACQPACPEGTATVAVARATSPRALRSGRTVLRRDQQARCERCGDPIAPAAMIRRVAALLGDAHADLAPAISRYCAVCRTLAPAMESPSPPGPPPAP